jgi:hypothetical protein
LTSGNNPISGPTIAVRQPIAMPRPLPEHAFLSRDHEMIASGSITRPDSVTKKAHSLQNVSQ